MKSKTDKIFDSECFTDSKESRTTLTSFLQQSSLQRLQQEIFAVVFPVIMQ
jgi:hypothetical protein